MDNLFGISLISILIVLNVMLLILSILYEHSNKKAIKELEKQQRLDVLYIHQILAGSRVFALKHDNNGYRLVSKPCIKDGESFIGGNKRELIDE